LPDGEKVVRENEYAPPPPGADMVAGVDGVGVRGRKEVWDRGRWIRVPYWIIIGCRGWAAHARGRG
jgi:hypothetical protein